MDARIYVLGLSEASEEPNGDEGFYSVGEYEYDPEKTVIEYPESKLTGMHGVSTKVTVLKDRVTVERTGPIESTMLYVEGEKHFIIYSTPDGEFSMGIDTESIENRLNERGGELKIKYYIDFQGTMPVETRILIRVSTGGERL